MRMLILFAAFLTGTLRRVSGVCPRPCVCSGGVASCAPGVSLVLDGCGCCRVCSAQLGQDCGAMRPCDHHRGLECNYGNDAGRTHGVCRAKLEGRSCEYQGRMYQTGENFSAGCKHQCTCIDGAVGCVPLCPPLLLPPLATPSCPAPRLVKVPGQCCPRLDCPQGNTVGLLPPQTPAYPPYPFMPYPSYPKPYPSYPSYPKSYPSYPYPKPYPKIYPKPYPKTYSKPYPKPFPKSYLKPYPKPDSSPPQVVRGNELVEAGPGRGKQQLAAWRQVIGQCVVQTTSWSPCSRSCGMGVSSRVTNDNGRCKLVKETRLCNVRPCSSLTLPVKRGRKCSRTHKSPEPVRLSYAGCRSVRLYRPNYCGVCVDTHRCCSPRRTRTAPAVAFSCPDGERFTRSVMFIQSCKCSGEGEGEEFGCGHLNDVALPPQKRWLYGDTHKFLD